MIVNQLSLVLRFQIKKKVNYSHYQLFAINITVIKKYPLDSVDCRSFYFIRNEQRE